MNREPEVLCKRQLIDLMKVAVLIFILVIPFNSFGQQPQSDSIHSKVLQYNSIPPFLDSLKTVIFQDTSKFNRADLIHTNMGTRNIGSYSPVFLINMKYSFKLDIINGKLVNQFVNNILDPKKIVRIDVMDTIYSQALLGVDGINACLFDPQQAAHLCNGWRNAVDSNRSCNGRNE